MMSYDWSAITFIIATIFLVLFMLYIPVLLGGRSKGRAKHDLFESGVVPAGHARIRFSAKFYLVAIFFVIFDLEALFLYAYAVSVREVNWLGFAGAAIFIFVLLVGLIYELSLGAMNWSPADRRPKKQPVTQQSFNLAAVTKFNGVEELEKDATGKVPAQLSGVVHSQSKK